MKASDVMGKSVKEVEEILSQRFPKSPSPNSIKPIDEDSVRFLFSGRRTLKDMVDEARDYFRHKYPEGKLGDIFFEAMELLIEKKRKEKIVAMPRKIEEGSRRAPKHVRVAVWERDEARCSYVSPEGRRCTETGGLEFDHKLPWALGGKSDDPDNIRLLCRTHNRLMADRYFGREYIEKQIAKKYQRKERDLCMNQFMLATWMNGGEIRPIKEIGPKSK